MLSFNIIEKYKNCLLINNEHKLPTDNYLRINWTKVKYLGNYTKQYLCDKNTEIYEIISKCTKIFFNCEYNDDINWIPCRVLRIKLGRNFNESINNLKNVRIIWTGDYFNKPINNLHYKTKSLKFGSCFNQKLNYIPNYCIHITTGYNFKKSCSYLPNSLNTFLIGGQHKENNVNNLPKSITNLIITRDNFKKINKYPKNIKFMTYHISLPTRNQLNYKIKLLKKLKINSLPTTIKKINLSFTPWDYKFPIIYGDIIKYYYKIHYNR